MFKLIAIDMDGTLLNSEHKVSDHVKHSLEKAKRLGIKIVLCSGRPIGGMRKYVIELGLNEAEDYVIAYNGAYMENTNTGKVVSLLTLDYSHLNELYEWSVDLNSPMHYFDIDNLYAPHPIIHKYTVLESYLNDIPIHYCPVAEFPEDRPIPNIMYIDEPANLKQTVEKLPSGITEKYAMVQSAPHFVEFTHPDATKGNALKILAKRLRIKQEEIMAIGDNGNDISMIEFAGCGVAMKNAISSVKAVADYETRSNNDDGVAHAIQELILNKAGV